MSLGNATSIAVQTRLPERIGYVAPTFTTAASIRRGNASSTYYQMIQRVNYVQNQIITHNIHHTRDKVAAFIITGGQDNFLHVAGELMMFWSELDFVFESFHS